MAQHIHQQKDTVLLYDTSGGGADLRSAVSSRLVGMCRKKVAIFRALVIEFEISSPFLFFCTLH
jgi:hypothetical protein